VLVCTGFSVENDDASFALAVAAVVIIVASRADGMSAAACEVAVDTKLVNWACIELAAG